MVKMVRHVYSCLVGQINMTIEVRDVWAELGPLFVGQSDSISEIGLTHIKRGSMSVCLYYLMTVAHECNFRFMLTGTDVQVRLSSPHAVVNYVLQGQVSLTMWMTLPGLPMISLFIDYTDEISFGYVRGSWNAMEVLAFFDLIYELKHMAPGSQVRPSRKSFSASERKRIMEVWRDYEHTSR